MLLGCFATLRMSASVRAPSLFNDSPSYDQLSFLGHEPRLWTVPLVYTLAPSNVLREGIQILVGIVAWSFLAVTVGGALRHHRMRHVALVAVLLLGLVPEIVLWDGAMLSESLSLSGLVILVGLLLRLRAPTPKRLAATLGVTLLWAFTRQTNLVTFLAISPLVVAFTFWRLPLRSAAPVALVVAAIAGWGAYALFVAEQTAPANHVIRFNSFELVTDRIALDPAALRYFVSHGMPRAPVAVAERARVPSLRIIQNVRFGRWIDRSFQQVYLGWLERQLPSAVSGSLQTVEQSLLTKPVVYGKARPILPAWLTSVLWPTTSGGVAVWLLCVLALLVAGIVSHRWMTGWLACGTAVLGAIAMGADTYLFSTQEYPRLLMPTALLLRLVMLFLLLFTADALVDGVRREPVDERRRYPYTPENPGVPEGGVSPAALHSSSPGPIAGAAASFGALAKVGWLKSK